jgi:hypothetical protein
MKGYDILFNLFKKYFTADQNKLLLIDQANQINNYFINWIIFGLVKDYLSKKNNIVYLKIKMKTETFTNNINQIIEGFDNNNKKNNNKKNNKSDKSDKKEKKDNKTKTSYYKFLLYCLLFGLLLFLCIYGIIIGFPIMINLIKKLFSLIMVNK